VSGSDFARRLIRGAKRTKQKTEVSSFKPIHQKALKKFLLRLLRSPYQSSREIRVFPSATNKSFLTTAKNLVFLEEQKSPPFLVETSLFSQRFMKKINRVNPTVG
jgi:hypothetical protein